MAPSRSVDVTFENYTSGTWNRTEYYLAHGAWTKFPPEMIQGTRSWKWASESDGFMTGTEGHVWYELQGGNVKFKVWWDSPYVGSSTYEFLITGHDAGNYIGTHTDDTSSNANVTFTLRHK